MGSSDSTLEEFSAVWEEHDFEEKVDDLDQTETMTAETPSMDRQTDVDPGNILQRLPRLSYRERDGRLAEVEIESMLGEGGMAYVLSANQGPLNREVAVKRLRSDLDREGNVLPLLQEAWITGKLEHPNIIPVYRLGRDDAGDPLIVMKRVEGVVWRHLVHDPSRAPGMLEGADPLDWHLDILAEVCNAIHYAHDRGIIHRDLKPENIMIGEFGEVYVLDWGLAAAIEPDRYDRIPDLEEVEAPAGTPAYMSPEMIEGDTDAIGVQSDVFLLGGLLHFALTGRPPNAGETTFEVMFDAYRAETAEFPDDVDDQIADICRRALSREPEDRYESAAAFREAILEYKQHRESLRLSARSEARLEDFREVLQGEHPEMEEAEIRQLFGECRFGFEQALEASAQNDAAREGLQETLELMIEFELDREGYEAASMLLNDLPERNSDLRERIRRLGRKLEAREQDLERLEELERATDTDIARHARSLVVIVLAFIWGGAGYWPGITERLGGWEPGWGLYLAATIVELGCLGGVIYRFRTELFQNRANRQIVAGVFLAFFTEGLIRYMSWGAGFGVGIVKAQQMVITFLVLCVMAIGIDRRLFWAAGPFLLGGILGANFQDYIHLINGTANVTGLGLLAWAWWPEESESS